MPIHATRIELLEPPPPEVLVGANVVLSVKVCCSEKCDLRALSLQVVGPERVASTYELTGPDGAAECAADLTLKIPPRVGEHTWTVSLARPDEPGAVAHEAASLAISLNAKAHDTSLAVWEIPSPVVAGARVVIKVGAKSSAACALSGRRIEVCDATGAVVACGALGATPWAGTSALYWTDVEFCAPAQTGLCIWTVRFDPAELDLPHQGTAAQFSLVAVPRPEHRLTVTVIEQEAKTPIPDMHVVLGPYRGMTNANGVAEIAVPGGRHDVNIWKVGFEAPACTVEMDGDCAVTIEAVIVPEEDPDAIWKM